MSISEHCFHFGPATSFFLGLLVFVLHSSPIAYWALCDLGAQLSVSYLFAFLYSSKGSQGKSTRVICHSLFQWIMFCQKPLLWPICLGWPCEAWLIASLSSASSFATTRQWSMKGALSLWPNNVPKASPLYTITLGVRVQHIDLGQTHSDHSR